MNEAAKAELDSLPDLSVRQRETFLFIAKTVQQTQRSPTVREICDATGLKTTNCSLHVKPLIRKGYLVKVRGRSSRNLRLTAIGQSWLEAHPTATARGFLRETREKPQMRRSWRIVSDPEILSGTPVFSGTRVPVKSLIELIEAGDPLETWMLDYPHVREEAP
jgi:uncharacterized protein (DUF433 family)